MKILVSLPVHECRRVIEDQLRNLTFFIKDVTIVLHVSQSYTESLDFSAFQNVIVNPVRLPTRWGNIGYLHIANIRHALGENIPFDYVLFCSSNELYIRDGVDAYIASADALLDPRGIISLDGTFTFTTHPRSVFYMPTAVISNAFSDEKWRSFIARHNLPGMCKSQIEGSAYRREIISEMLELIDAELGAEYCTQIRWCGEEILIPTVFLAVAKRRPGFVVRRQCSFVDWCHDFTARMWIRAIRHWRLERTNERVAAYLKEIDAPGQIYAIKGVERTYYNTVRNHVRTLLPKTEIATHGYRAQDRAYRWTLMKRRLQPVELAIWAGQSALGVASRMIGKPKGYLVWAIRERRKR